MGERLPLTRRMLPNRATIVGVPQSLSSLAAAFQPRRLMIAPADAGCKRLIGRPQIRVDSGRWVAPTTRLSTRRKGRSYPS